MWGFSMRLSFYAIFTNFIAAAFMQYRNPVG